MSKGYKPDDILAVPRQERIMYMAMAELNMEQEQNDLQNAVLEAHVKLLKAMK